MLELACKYHEYCVHCMATDNWQLATGNWQLSMLMVEVEVEYSHSQRIAVHLLMAVCCLCLCFCFCFWFCVFVSSLVPSFNALLRGQVGQSGKRVSKVIWSPRSSCILCKTTKIVTEDFKNSLTRFVAHCRIPILSDAKSGHLVFRIRNHYVHNEQLSQLPSLHLQFWRCVPTHATCS